MSRDMSGQLKEIVQYKAEFSYACEENCSGKLAYAYVARFLI